ncbi:SCP1.201-like deaminase [Lentzea albidocapillata subsp. violacea]|uniref:SCP1.201-like deaminase n=1 Tax=Lentzea albidocapillata subsp. violacea TaxID=128104 RepID=A0A1G8WUD7_9PSEU|nr:SCP1.201-like deaminase [Lentzea albidocapillata subsp. violacea]
MATLGDVIAALRASVERLPFTELADALDAAEEARSLIEQASAGSGQAEFHRVLDWFSQVISGIDQLQCQLSAIHAGVTGAANRLEGSGRTSEVLHPVSPVPSRTQGASLLGKLPKREGGKTSGIWVDESGVEHDIVSGEHDWQQARAVLAELRIGPAHGTLWVAAHVEVKLAAALRGLAAKRVTLAVNNEPCNEGRWSCDRLLSRILKPGQTVTIHWPGGEQTYRGKEAQT